VNDAGVPGSQRAEELAAYAIENREAAPAGLRTTADNLVGAVKAWFLRRFGIQAGSVTPGQLRALALAALRSVDTGTKSRGAAYSLSQIRERIKQIIEQSKEDGHAPQKADIAPVPEWLIDMAARNGLNVSGFRHIIDGSSVRHTRKNHENAQTEKERGQLAVKLENYQNIPEVIAAPDRVFFGTKTALAEIKSYMRSAWMMAPSYMLRR
jgi:hypothetical protein